jgi:uncharacterized protein YcaQ
MDRLSPSQARRMALAAQGFTDRTPAGRVDRRHARRAIGRVGVIQIDSVNVLVRSHELPLYSRLGPHSRDLLPRMAYRDRELFEYWGHMASYLPVELEPLLRWRMERASQEAWGGMVRLAKQRPGYVEAVYDEVVARGPISASELIDPGAKRSEWWGWGDGKTTLEFLFWSGRLGAAHRGANFERSYDIVERIIPAEVRARPTPEPDAARRELLALAARSLGVATAADLADYFRIRMPEARPRIDELVEDNRLLPVDVEGWRHPAFVHPDATIPRWVRARTLLSPFDSLVWDRGRTERLFDFHLRLEIYTPAHKRVHGYYVLPFLLGDRLAARVDLKADRKAATLVVVAAHVEQGEDDLDVAEQLAPELARLGEWLGLERVSVADRGDLAPALRTASPAT